MKIFVPGRLRAQSLGPLFLLTWIAVPSGLKAQEEVIPIIHGEVREGDAPLPGAMVVLHQVSNEMSGPIDSVRAAGDGTFQLRLPRVPDHGVRSDVYFASVRHLGLLYMGPAITSPVQLDSLYLIQAFDTLSVPPGGATLPISVRNLFLEKLEEGWQATDFLQLRQGGERTLYSPEEGVVWRYPLPPSAEEFEVGQADLAPDAVRFQAGDLALYAPIPPGERFLLVRYRIPVDEFIIPMPGTTERMEVLVRTPGPEAEFPPLAPSTPLELEPGNVFRRYAGNDLRDAEVLGRVRAAPFRFRAEWIGLLLAAVLGGAGVFAYRARGPKRGETAQGGAPPRREDLVLAIARLDEAFQEGKDLTQEDSDEYLARRRALLDQLKRRS
jgi:hypothetical protein